MESFQRLETKIKVIFVYLQCKLEQDICDKGNKELKCLKIKEITYLQEEKQQTRYPPSIFKCLEVGTTVRFVF